MNFCQFHHLSISAGNLDTLNVTAATIMPFGAIIEVKAMHYDDNRVLLGYVLYFKAAPFNNVTLFDSRDACGGDGWRIEEMPQSSDKRESEASNTNKTDKVQIVMTKLRAYTQYAYYVKTYAITSEPRGGQSDIKYLRTLPWQPESVQKLKVVPSGSSSFVSCIIFTAMESSSSYHSLSHFTDRYLGAAEGGKWRIIKLHCPSYFSQRRSGHSSAKELL